MPWRKQERPRSKLGARLLTSDGAAREHALRQIHDDRPKTRSSWLAKRLVRISTFTFAAQTIRAEFREPKGHVQSRPGLLVSCGTPAITQWAEGGSAVAQPPTTPQLVTLASTSSDKSAHRVPHFLAGHRECCAALGERAFQTAPLLSESGVRLRNPLPARGRGVGEWGLNKCPEPNPPPPVSRTPLVGKASVCGGWKRRLDLRHAAPHSPSPPDKDSQDTYCDRPDLGSLAAAVLPPSVALNSLNSLLWTCSAELDPYLFHDEQKVLCPPHLSRRVFS
jgi:hypothetical protein